MISILIAEDDTKLLTILRTHLIRKYHVNTANNGDTLEKAVASDTYQIILLDLNMPHFIADRFLNRLWDDQPNTKVIIISGSIDKTYTEDFKNVLGVMPKPFEIDRLMQMIERTLKADVEG